MGGFYQDLRKHEGAVPARVNEVLALLYGGEHLAAGARATPQSSHSRAEIIRFGDETQFFSFLYQYFVYIFHLDIVISAEVNMNRECKETRGY